MPAGTQLSVALVTYGLAPILVLVAGYFGWKRVRSGCRRYGTDRYDVRASEREKFWGYE